MSELTAIARIGLALSDSTRLRLIAALRGGELCACQLIELVGLAPSTVSKHLALLRDAGLVESRKEGRWVYYRQPQKNVFPMVGSAAKSFLQTLEKCSEVQADNRRLKAIRGADLEVLCRQQRRR